MNYKTRATGTLVVALIFLALAVSTWLYGSGRDQYIDAVLAGIASLSFFLLSFYIFQQGEKR
jgi:hypothetical protein